ncbi:MAG: FGGY-family carbohydrate kinase [Anaerolineae bacterium]|jgi:xylulokinase|nr:FGGY-family carbohydrate kinase [Anaerolineae bacterium]
MKALLGLDIGTTSTKAVLFDTSGTELSRANSPAYTNKIPQPGWVEQDPEEIWQAVITAIRGAVKNALPDTEILALSIAAQSGSLIPANHHGEPIYNLITWMDGRTEALVQKWRVEGLPEKIKSINGWTLNTGQCLPTIAWLEANARAEHYFSVNDFITHRLTGKFVTNPSNAGGMQLLNLHTGDWDEYLCSLAGITPTALSRIQLAGTPISRISDQASSATGLSTQTLLINGGHDQGISALGLGINDPGKFLLACGTAWVISGVTDSVDIASVPAVLDWNFHPLKDRWIISQSLGGLGASLEWWLNQAWQGVDVGGASRSEMFKSLDAELAEASPNSSLFFLPLTGGYDNPSTTQSGRFIGLQLSHNRANMAWAILESAAFELRWAIEEAGLTIEELWMLGGAAESPQWVEILATVTGIPISLPQYDNWPALGAAVLAGVGAELFDSVEDALKNFEKPVRKIAPIEALRVHYDDLFERYKGHRKALPAR